MNKEIKRFVRFISPGSFVAETWTRPVEDTNPRNVAWPDNAYAFTMHEREDVIDGDKRYESKQQQIGLIYYHPDSKVETLEEVKRNPKATPILISNMECNRWSHIVWSRWGNWPQPFDAKGAFVLPRGDAA